MIILIGGCSHTGKTLLAQKLMVKYKIPYVSIDHIKMGLYRGWKRCGFTPVSKDEVITKKLWPIIKGVIMTNIENNQNIIIEGVNLPYSLIDLENKYTSKIIFFRLCFSEEYIKSYLKNKIIKYQSCIEKRGSHFEYSINEFIEFNKIERELCKKNKIKNFEICENYDREIKEIMKWVSKELKK